MVAELPTMAEMVAELPRRAAHHYKITQARADDGLYMRSASTFGRSILVRFPDHVADRAHALVSVHPCLLLLPQMFRYLDHPWAADLPAVDLVPRWVPHIPARPTKVADPVLRLPGVSIELPHAVARPVPDERRSSRRATRARPTRSHVQSGE